MPRPDRWGAQIPTHPRTTPAPGWTIYILWNASFTYYMLDTLIGLWPMEFVSYNPTIDRARAEIYLTDPDLDDWYMKGHRLERVS